MYKFTFTIVVLFFSLSQASACGTVEWAIDGIYGKGPMKSFSRKELFSGLAKVGGPCSKLSNSMPTRNQKKLANLLLDDQFNRYLVEYGKKIFLEFNCLNTQKENSIYTSIISRYGIDGCPKKNIFFVTSTNGGNLRSSPNISDNKLTVLPEGATLREISRKGEWIKIEVIRYNPYFTPPCKYKSPCKTGYIHQSLID
jgi:hypothetical protein